MEFIHMNNNNLKEQKSLSDKLKYICSIPVKNEGRALNTIFILCLISIIALSIYLYRVSTSFYKKLDSTMENNINMNMEFFRNEKVEYFEDFINNRIHTLKNRNNIT